MGDNEQYPADNGEHAQRHYHQRRTDSHDGDSHGDNNQHDDGGSTQHKEDEKDDDKKDEKPQKMSPQKKRLLIAGAIVLVIILIVAATLYYLHSRHYEDTDDAFIDGHVSQVSPQISGRVLKLLIRDNEQVQAGQPLLEIDPSDYEVRLTQAQAQLLQAQAQVLLQQANIGQAQANVEVAEAQVFQAQRDLVRFRSIDPKAITTQQLDNAIANAKSADARLEANRKAVDAAKGQLAVAQASVQTANADIQNAQLQLSYTKIMSPITGRVTRRTVEVGNVVSAGLPLLAIVSDDLWVTANFKETQLALMKVGQHVDIHVDAFPQANLHAHIDSFQRGTGQVFSTLPAENATGNYVKVVQRVPVKILFDDPKQRDHYPIAPGLSVEPRVQVR